MADQPLWQAMRRAYDQSSVPDELLESADAYDCLSDRYGYAAEIRALQRHILPDEPPITRRIQGNAVAKALYMQRQRLRAVLTAEAERAEKGEE
jgi:hypothetical protein